MEIGDLPTELTSTLLQPIVLVGLDINNSQAHRSIWDAFIVNRSTDRLPLNFKLLNAEHEFPKPKPLKNFDSEIPRGILKTNWLRKHLGDIPAVLVLFIDLDWAHPQWDEKVVECASKVKSIRHSLEGRNIRLALVLVQTTPLAPAEAIAAEKVAELCNSCEIPLKLLFVLPSATHQLFGYILRLEHAFYELAQAYYQVEAKRVKSRKDALNKLSHRPLFVRYQFKIAIFNELRQDAHSALRHYKMAYQSLQEIKLDETHAMEIKTVGGMLNYKICRLCFQNNTPLDAIAQFTKHVEYFKSFSGPSDLLFEHHAWLAKQFYVFGELFDEAVLNGLAAIQTQHPGFYYQSASEQAIARKGAALRLCNHLASVAYPAASDADPLSQAGNLTYFGQRPWRSFGLTVVGGDGGGIGGIAALDANLETLGVMCLQWREARYDHTTLVLQYLNKALVHFKRYRCPRMKLLTIVRMGEQYFGVGNYEKALHIFSHAGWEYRKEKWWLPLRVATSAALKCAYALADVKSYVALALEALNPCLRLDSAERFRIQTNLSMLFAGRVPDVEMLQEPFNSSTNGEARANAVDLWRKLLDDRCFFLLGIDSVRSCLEATARFSEESCRASAKIRLTVYLRSTAPATMSFSRLLLQFSNSAYDEFCASEPGAIIILPPDELQTFKFEFYPLATDVNSRISLTSITLDVGNAQASLFGRLQWEQVANSNFSVRPEHAVGRKLLTMEFVQPRTSIKILPREARLTIAITHNPPILTGERYKIQCVLKNLENSTAERLRFRATMRDDERSSLGAGFDGCAVGELTKEFTSVATNEEVMVELTVYCERVTNEFTIYLEAEYDVLTIVDEGNTVVACHCIASERLELVVISPFLLNSSLISYKSDVLNKLLLQEPSIVKTEIKCLSSESIVIESVEWQLINSLQSKPNESTAKLQNMIMQSGEVVNIHTSVVPTAVVNEPECIGNLLIRWRREKNSARIVETVYHLLSSAVDSFPVLITCDIPPYGVVRHSLIVSYQVRNQLPSILEVTAALESTEPFTFSGHKHTLLRLLPCSEMVIKFVLIPLIAGHVALPRLKLSCSSFTQEAMDFYAQRNVPVAIFVLPFGKEQTGVAQMLNCH